MRDNQNGMGEVEARGKGEHSYYKWKGTMFHGVDKGLIACGGVPKGSWGPAGSRGHDRLPFVVYKILILVYVVQNSII